MKIGVIAEETNDVDVLYELTCKLTSTNNFSFCKFVGHGCGKLRKKCAAWAGNLIDRGCNHLVVIHDLDENDETELRTGLANRVKHIGFDGYVILIPVREIEAWLLTDAAALRSVFSMGNIPKVPNNPEQVLHPKEKLREIVWKYSKKHYFNTIHNKRIAAISQINKITICKSFRPYPQFINTFITN